MAVLSSLEPKQVFKYFEEISSVPRGSGNMNGIADFCVNFAEKHGLKYIRDDANNIVIYKDAAKGYESAEPIILQGHLDMVCQKTNESSFDFEKDGLELLIDGEFIKANGTTLGADNGIAVAMVLSILESDSIPHPAIEAVFTTDEEIGMIGATAFDSSVLSAKKMINLDSEEINCVTVSCAGGSDFTAKLPVEREKVSGNEITITLKGLKGGHSGICINEGRVNANLLAGRILNYLNNNVKFSLVSVSGGDKINAITPICEIKVITTDDNFKTVAEKYIDEIKTEIAHREPEFFAEIDLLENKTADGMVKKSQDNVIYALLLAPNGVIEMSAEIDGLVETSLNLGILKTEETYVSYSFGLRSNKKTAIKFLDDKLTAFFSPLSAEILRGGYYPPWEFNDHSELQKLYIDSYVAQFGEMPKVEAIHAGLECGVFADKIDGFDAIAIGPQMYDVHTVNERLEIKTVGEIYKLLLKILENCQ